MRKCFFRSPPGAALASLLLPGAGHALLGRRRAASITSIAFAVPVVAACRVAAGGTSAFGMAPGDLAVGLAWLAFSAWLFAVWDSYCCAGAPADASDPAGAPNRPSGLNPRAAFALNLGTRGLGYVYLDRPVLGGLAIVGLGALAAALPPAWEAALFALQAGLALHAWQVAARVEATPRPKGGESDLQRAVNPGGLTSRRSLRGALIAGMVVAAGWGVGQAAVRMGTPTVAAWEPPIRAAAGYNVLLSGAGLGFRLPAPDWRLDTRTDSPVVCLRCPRATLLLFSSGGPAGLGLDGYVVALAGHLAAQYGPIRLSGQRTLESPAGPVREIRFEWTERGVPAASHVYLLAQGDQVYTFLVSAPARLGAGVRGEIERLVGSLRVTE